MFTRCHKNINTPLDGPYLADFGIDNKFGDTFMWVGLFPGVGSRQN